MSVRGARAAGLAALALIGLSALGAAVWWQRCALAEAIARRAFLARGVAARLRVVRLDWGAAELAELTLGDARAPDLALAQAELAWSWEGVRAHRLDRLVLRGLRVRARVDASGLHLGSLDALRGPGGAAGEPLTLPFLEARLEDAQAALDSPQGALRLRAEGSARPEGEIVRAELTLHGDSERGALDFGGGGTLNLATQEIAAVGTLSGVTPWGSAEGFVRAQGSLEALRAEVLGTAQPDARALPLRAGQPIRVSGVVTRGADGALEARGKLAAREITFREVVSVEALTGDATLRDDASGLAGTLEYSASGLRVPEVGEVARAEGRATLRAGQVQASGALRDVVLPDLARAPQATLDASLELSSGALRVSVEAADAIAPELARIGGLAAQVELAGDALRGEVRVARLVELSRPPLIAPLRVHAKLSGSLERVELAGRALTPGDGLALDFSGWLWPARGQLELKIVLPETDVSPKTRQPGRVFPWLADVIQAMRGKLSGQALATYANDALGASGVIALDGADVVTEWGTIRGLMGVVTLTAIDPLQTPPGQTVWMQSVDAGLPLGAGSLKFQLRPDSVIDVERGEWGFAGGKLFFSDAIPLEAPERRIELHVESVSLEKLLAALDFEGLSGTGALGGVAPIVQRGDHLFVQGGELHATELGVIRFTSGEGSAALARKQPLLEPLLGALADLHYDQLTLAMDGDLSDRVAVKMHIRGRNPNFQQGRLVVLNVNVDLPLGSLLRAAAVATGVPREIEERVQKAMSEEKP